MKLYYIKQSYKMSESETPSFLLYPIPYFQKENAEKEKERLEQKHKEQKITGFTFSIIDFEAHDSPKCYEVIDETSSDPSEQYSVGIWLDKEKAEKWIEEAIKEDEMLTFTIHEFETKD